MVAVTDQTKAEKRNQGFRDMQANVAALAKKKLELRMSGSGEQGEPAHGAFSSVRFVLSLAAGRPFLIDPKSLKPPLA